MAECTPEEFEEFKTEATELLDEAEAKILAIDKGEDFSQCYDATFRVFHSLKGASGFLGLLELQEHMHQLEGQYQQLKPNGAMSKPEISYFLRGVDAARKILGGDKVHFNHSEFDNLGEVAKSLPESQPAPVVTSEEAISTKVNLHLAFIVGSDPSKLNKLEGMLREEHYDVKVFSDIVMALAVIDREHPTMLFLALEKSIFSAEECLVFIKEKSLSTELALIVSDMNEVNTQETNSLSFLDTQAQDTVFKASLRTITKINRLSQLLKKTVDTLYHCLPELALVMEEAGKEELLSEVSRDFRALISEQRLLRVS
jgi:chemotaxis protein histidine kinase CheA